VNAFSWGDVPAWGETEAVISAVQAKMLIFARLFMKVRVGGFAWTRQAHYEKNRC